MYMHLFNVGGHQVSELKIGNKYQVIGYYTGNFVGECVAVDSLTAIFRVLAETPHLRFNDEVEVQLKSRVKIERFAG